MNYKSIHESLFKIREEIRGIYVNNGELNFGLANARLERLTHSISDFMAKIYGENKKLWDKDNDNA